MCSSFVSFMYLNGKPILPPLMTREKREEMQNWRSRAIELEKKMQLKTNLSTKGSNIQKEVEEENTIICDDTITSETLGLDTAPEETEPPIPVEISTPKLIRSNSYTLEKPSPLLLKFLMESNEKQKKDKISTVKNSKKMNVKKVSGSFKINRTPESRSTRKSKSIGDSPRRKSKSIGDSPKRKSLSKKEKSLSKSKSPKIEKSHISINSTLNSSSNKNEDIKDNSKFLTLSKIQKICLELEENHKKKQAELFAKHEEEQKRFQEEYQKQIMAKLEALNIDQNNSTLRTSTPFSESKSNTTNNETSFYSTIQGDESPLNSSMTLVSEAYSKNYLANIRHSFMSPDSRQKAARAATIINSHARGYLIRRLLRTNHVQSIIDGIKSILIIILSSNTAADAKTKRSLLQQLNDGVESLHNVFFELSTNERLAIIAADRKFIKAQLMTNGNHKQNTP